MGDPRRPERLNLNVVRSNFELDYANATTFYSFPISLEFSTNMGKIFGRFWVLIL